MVRNPLRGSPNITPLDWSHGITCIVSGGQSAPEILPYLDQADHVLVINRAFELVPQATALYAADRSFWQLYKKAHKFAGTKISADVVAGVENVVIERRNGERFSHMMQEPLGVVGYGGNSGFQALNLAVQFGARKIVLAGFDFVGSHWHEDHKGRNPTKKALIDWANILDGEAKTLQSWGVNILNCSMLSKLRQYQKCKPADFKSLLDAL